MQLINWLSSLKALSSFARRRKFARTESTFEQLESRALLATIMVTSTDDSGSGTLRQAILDSNASLAEDDVIAFSIPGSGNHEIELQSALPLITDKVTIDGWTQPGFNGAPRIHLVGDDAGDSSGLVIKAKESIVRGIGIQGFLKDGIVVDDASDVVLHGNYVGVAANGISTAGNAGHGISVDFGALQGENPVVLFQVDTSASVSAQFSGSPVGDVNNDGRANTIMDAEIAGLVAAVEALIAQGRGNDVPIGVENFDMDLVTPGLQRTVFANSDTDNNGVSDVIDMLKRLNTTVDGIRYDPFHPDLTIAVDFFTALNTPFGDGNLIVVSDGYIYVSPQAVIDLDNLGVNRRAIAVGAGSSLATMQRIDPEAVLVTSTDELRDAALSIIAGGTGHVQIGGLDQNQPNLIANNGAAGVRINGAGATQITVSGNSIFNNGALGIDIAAPGPTINDFDDSDSGANNQINYPRITSVVERAGTTFIRGIVQAIPDTTYHVELFTSLQPDPSGYGQGQTFVVGMDTRTDAGGTGVFEYEFSGSLNNRFVSATSTGIDGNTSEFSVARKTDESDPFADFASSYSPLNGGGPAPTSPNATDPVGSLERPDDQSVSLGHGGRLEVEFIDNELTNTGDEQFDLQIYEQDSADRVFVALRPTAETLPRLPASADADGDGFFDAGFVSGGLSYLDIDAAFPGFAPGQLVFDAVQLTDDINQGDAGVSAPTFPLFVHDIQGNLASLNVSTGAVSMIGNTGIPLTDIAVNLLGEMYGVTTSHLYRINPGSATASLVGPTGVNTNSLEFANDGTLYAAGSSTNLFTLDVQTGLATVVGGTGVSAGGDLGFSGDTLYLTSASNDLIELDLDNGVSAKNIGPLGSSIQGIDSSTGPLLGVRDNSLFGINLTTGAATSLLSFAGQGLASVNGAAFGIGGGNVGNSSLTESVGADIDAVVALEFNSLDGDYIIEPTGVGTSVSEAGVIDTLAVKLISQPESNVVIDLNLERTDQAAIDRTSLTFTPANWDVPQIVTVRAIDDFAAEGDQALDIVFSVTASSEKRFALLEDKVVTFLVQDNDDIGFELSKTTSLVSELGTEDSFSIRLASLPASDVVFEVVSDDTGEVAVSSSSVTFTPVNWNIPQVVTVTGVDDVNTDGDQDVPVTVFVNQDQSDNQYDVLDDQVVTVTVADDDQAGLIVTQSDGVTSSRESGSPDSFVVSLATQPLSNVFVNVSSADTSEANVSDDFVILTPANWNTGVAVDVVATDDVFVDGTHSVLILLSIDDANSDDAYDDVADQSFLVETQDDDEAGFILSKETLTVTESESTSFTVLLTSAPLSDVVIKILSSDIGEAVVSPSSLTITPDNWGDFHTIAVTGVDDGLVDGSKDLSLRLLIDDETSDDEFDPLAEQVIGVTVNDSDIPGFEFSESFGNTRVAEFGSSDSFTVNLTAQPEQDVVIGILAGDGTEMNINRRRLTFTSLNWNVPQTVTVTGADDAVIDGLQNSTITLQIEDHNSSPSFADVEDQTFQVSTLDDDAAGFVISKTSATVDEAGPVDTFHVTLASRPDSTVNFVVNSQDVNEVRVSTSVLTFSPATWNVPRTVTLFAETDDTNDGDKTTDVEVAIVPDTSDPKFSQLNRQVVVVTTIDNDRARVTGPVGITRQTSPVIQIAPRENAVSHEIWLELLGGDSNPVANPTITGNSYVPENLAAGRYRTWVRANFADGLKSGWHTADFEVHIPPQFSPVNQTMINRQPTLSWPAVAGASTYRLFINNLSSGVSAVIDETVAAESIALPEQLGVGRFRAWVQAIGNGVATWSEPQEYTVGSQLLAPAESAVVTRPEFSWSPAPGASTYRLYVSGPDGLVMDLPGISNTSFTPDFPFSNGQHRWWVQPQHESGFKGEWSSAGNLIVAGSPRILESSGVTTDGTPEFSWAPRSDASSFEVFFRHDASQRVIRHETGLTTNTWESIPVADGKYTAWVRSVDSEGIASRWSDPLKLDVQSATVAITADPVSPILPTFDTTPTFEWSVFGPAAEYDLHVWNDDARIENEGLRSRFWTPPAALAAGRWNWAVRGISAAGAAGPWRFATTDTSGAGQLLSPRGSTSDQTPTLSWTTVAGASRYELRVDNLTTAETFVIDQTQLTASSFTVAASLPAGEYRAWITAINSANNTSAPVSAPLDFTIVADAATESLNEFDFMLSEKLAPIARAVNKQSSPAMLVQDEPTGAAAVRQRKVEASEDSGRPRIGPAGNAVDMLMASPQQLSTILSGRS